MLDKVDSSGVTLSFIHRARRRGRKVQTSLMRTYLCNLPVWGSVCEAQGTVNQKDFKHNTKNLLKEAISFLEKKTVSVQHRSAIFWELAELNQ